MKRRTMFCVVVMLAMLATAPAWAAPVRVSNTVDQAFEWLGAFWSAVWGQGGICIDPDGQNNPAPQGSGLVYGADEGGGTTPQGGCGIDPDGRPLCPPSGG